MAYKYRPRRARKCWLEGAPPEVLDVIDDPEFADRYTVLLCGKMLVLRNEAYAPTLANTIVPYLGMSGNPRSPQGVCMWGQMYAWDAAAFRYAKGHRRIKWGDLPDEVKNVVVEAVTKGD